VVVVVSCFRDVVCGGVRAEGLGLRVSGSKFPGLAVGSEAGFSQFRLSGGVQGCLTDKKTHSPRTLP
jgi:hypothetical protein